MADSNQENVSVETPAPTMVPEPAASLILPELENRSPDDSIPQGDGITITDDSSEVPSSVPTTEPDPVPTNLPSNTPTFGVTPKRERNCPDRCQP